ncbi:MAG: FAD-binding domain-containing protein [Pseudomonadota bacterium]
MNSTARSDPMAFHAGHVRAKEQLAAFLPRAGKAYADSRNFDYGPARRENISCLSPYIRHRLITEEEVLRATLEQHDAGAAEKFIAEIFWRGYFRGWLEHRPAVWADYARQVPEWHHRLADNSGHKTAYDEAVQGRTGIDCFDTWASKLVTHGYLHNHARMWFASIWIFTLRLPWQLGADFFLSHLLDGDAASNTLSWRWVAGLHTKGKHYLARCSNIERYSDGRFSPTGLVEDAASLSEDVEYPRLMPDMPENAPINGDFALLLHGEDCSPETLPLSDKTPKLVLGLTPGQTLPYWTPEVPVAQFTGDAITDALKRAASHWNAPTASVTNPGTVIAAMQQSGVEILVMPHIPTGPLNDIWHGWRHSLTDAGIRVQTMLRDYDRAVWPHASRGFFKLKQRIPEILATRGLL